VIEPEVLIASVVMEHEVLIANQLSDTLLHADPALAHQTISEMLRLAHSQVKTKPCGEHPLRVEEGVVEAHERERVLFIGTQFSILYTSVYPPTSDHYVYLVDLSRVSK
jgi:hypothetical protein